jgi:hypothetical protein
MNDGKTEFLVIGTRQQLCKLQPISISVNNSVISPSPHIKNFGSWLDSNLNMTTHITKVCKACFFHLHNIRRIKKYLSRDNLLILVHAFITSRLHYCNSLFYGLPGKQISKLQRVQNAVARLVMDVPKSILILRPYCMNYTGFQYTLQEYNSRRYYLLLKLYTI